MPIVGVIEPGAEAAVAIAKRLSDAGDPRGGRIGVLGTTRTIASGAYVRAVAGRSSRIEVIGQAEPLLVPLVEEGWLEGDVPRLARSEEHTSELQSRLHLVCRLLPEKK